MPISQRQPETAHSVQGNALSTSKAKYLNDGEDEANQHEETKTYNKKRDKTRTIDEQINSHNGQAFSESDGTESAYFSHTSQMSLPTHSINVLLPELHTHLKEPVWYRLLCIFEMFNQCFEE